MCKIIKQVLFFQRHSDAVVEALVRLWNAGLVYRKESLINWSCQLSSAISDIEVDKIRLSGPTPLSIPGYDSPVVFGELTEFVYKVYDSGMMFVCGTFYYLFLFKTFLLGAGYKV